MKAQNIILLLFALFLLHTNMSFAEQAGNDGPGGGSINEIERVIATEMVKRNILKIERFLREDKVAAEVFQEVDAKKFSKVVSSLILQAKIKIIADGDPENDDSAKTRLVDKYGIERTALNYPQQGVIEYDYEEIRQLTNRPKEFFVLNFHEILGLMGLEENDPKYPDLYMGYHISSRLERFVNKRLIDEYDLFSLDYRRLRKEEYPTPLLELDQEMHKALINSEVYNAWASHEMVTVRIYKVGLLNDRQFVRVLRQIFLDEKHWDTDDGDFSWRNKNTTVVHEYQDKFLEPGVRSITEYFEILNFEETIVRKLNTIDNDTTRVIAYHHSDGSELTETGNFFYLKDLGLILRVGMRFSEQGSYEDFFTF